LYCPHAAQQAAGSQAQGIGVYFGTKVGRSSQGHAGRADGKAPGKTLVESASAISDTSYLQYAPAGNSKGFPGGFAIGSAIHHLVSTGSYTKANGATLLREGEEMSVGRRYAGYRK
jgi:hypothetical protein